MSRCFADPGVSCTARAPKAALRSVRAALLWNPTDRLSIEPSFLYQEITQGGLNLIDGQPGTNTQYQPYDSPEPFEDRIDIGSLNLK